MITLRKRIWDFFEKPESRIAKFVYFFLVFLIFLSVGLTLFEIKNPDFVTNNSNLFFYVELVIVACFSVEYLLRFISSPNRLKFPFQFMNIIDLLAILPFFIGITHSGSIRLIRILRFFRLFRMLKLLRYSKILNTFKYRNTIFEKVTPVAVVLLSIKGLIWFFESAGLWIAQKDLQILMTIIGFALGIILSQKIGVTYGKYRELERTMFRMHGKLSSLRFFINHAMKQPLGKIGISKWLRQFLEIYHCSQKKDNRRLVKINEQLYENIVKVGNTDLIPHHRLTALMIGIFEDASFILSRKTSYTPIAYDNLLLHVTMMYLLLITIFIPGINGFISVLVATYLLYGMYYVTQDFDLAIGNDDNPSLIKLSPAKLENYLKEISAEF